MIARSEYNQSIDFKKLLRDQKTTRALVQVSCSQRVKVF